MGKKRQQTEFDRFKELVTKIFMVPKSEIAGKPGRRDGREEGQAREGAGEGLGFCRPTLHCFTPRCPPARLQANRG